MTEEYIPYTTKQDDRWDLIAYEHYGDAKGFQRIVKANPSAPKTPLLPGGVKLLIPVVSPEQVVRDEDLPPWKRGGE